MAKEIYTVESVVRTLNKVSGIKIKGNTIQTIEGAALGMKVWGKIDFLRKNGFNLVTVNSSKLDKEDKSSKRDFEEPRRKKKKKSIDAISGVKSVMKMSNFKIKK